MLGRLNNLLLKLCDPRNSAISSDTSLSQPRVRTFGRIARSTTARKRPQNEDPLERHDTVSNHSHNLQSAINKLPYELLAELFATVCHADSDQFLGDRNRHKKTTPLVLGSVCSSWRVVVRDNPRIWSHVSLCLSSPSGRYNAQVSLLKEWFERSGVCPLTINIVFHNEDDWTTEIAHDLINVLVEQAFRWRSINFVLPEAWYPFLESIKDNVNQLTTVSTQPLWADCGLSPSKRKQLTIFEDAPLLDDLHLNGYYLTDVFLRWSQLTRMTLQHVYLDECFHALPLTPNLTWCRIYTILINDVNRTVVEPDFPIVLNKLKTFIVYGAAWGDLLRLLSSVSSTLLESFEISALFDDLVFPQLSTALPLFTTARGHPSSLTRLVLTDLDFTSRPAFQVERDLKALLRETPMLEEVEIEVSRKADRENATFCSWWFIDLLGVQEEPGAELLAHGEGKERGRFEVGSRNSDISEDDDLHQGKVCSFKTPSRDPGRSLVSLRETLPPPPCYLLPNLHSFTFSGPVIAHACVTSDESSTSDTDHAMEKWPTFPHPASFHLPPKLRNDKGFSRTLLEVLSTRGGFGSHWVDASYDAQVDREETPVLLDATEDDIKIEVEAPKFASTVAETDKDDIQKIYFLDDEDKILALPADVLPEAQPDAKSVTASGDSLASPVSEFSGPGLPAKTTPLNLRNNLGTFNLRATTYKSVCTMTTGLGWRNTCCMIGMKGASKEAKAGLRRLTEEGGMKMKVVLGGDIWIS